MNIALIAHDAKKKLMQNFCIAYRGILSRNSLYATGTTGRLIEEVTNLNVHKYLAGHLGGEQQICAQIEHNEIDLVIFLRDPMTPKMHEPTVNNILRLCDDPDVTDVIRFLREREVVHFQRFGDALRVVQDLSLIHI